MRLPLAAVLAAACALRVLAQGEDETNNPIFVEEDEAAPLLDQAAKAEREGRWPDAIEKYQRVLREHPDQLRRTEQRMWTSVRAYVFERISRFPEDGRKAYLDMNDAVAKSLYEQAVRDRDIAGTEKVANEYFFTTVGDDASRRIADVYAEQGRLADAAFYWERVVTLYPQTDQPLAALAAKWGAACRRLGDEAGWEAARRKLEGLGEAKLRLGGREVTAAAAAAALAAIAPLAERAESPEEWPRMGGNNSGSRLSTAASKNEIRLWTWPDRTPEQMIAQAAAVKQASRTQQAQMSFMQYHAAVADGAVVIGDGATVFALSLETGKPLWSFPERSDPNLLFMQVLRDAPRIMSLCAPVIADGRVYVNFLPRSVQWQNAEPEKTWLCALSLEDAKLLWTTKDEEKLAETWFGSPPVVYGGRIYAAVANSSNGDPEVSLVVLDAGSGKLLRKTFLCSGTRQNAGWGWWSAVEAPIAAEHGGVIYVNTNIGAVGAVHACTGEILWLSSYLNPGQPANPRVGRRPVEQTRNGRGLNPIVIHEGRVCCLPGDVENYCEFDARTGKRLLSVPAAIPNAGEYKPGTGELPKYFLGIRANKAWLAGTRSMGFIDFGPEKLNRENPLKSQYIFPLTGTGAGGAGTTPIQGRGFLSAEAFYAATMQFLVAYRAQNAKLLLTPTASLWDPALKGTDAGHLIVAGNRLLCLSDAGLTCFTDQESFDATFKGVLTAADPDPAILEKHAEVLARNPRTYPGAIADYEKIVALGKDRDGVARARERLVSLHRALGDQKLAGPTKDYAGAIEHYKKAVDAAPPDAPMGDLFRVMGDCYEKLNRWVDAVAMYQEVLTKYGDRMVTLTGGLTQSVRQFATEKIARIVAEHGAEVYEAVEHKAQELFDKVKDAEGVEELRRWWESFPNSSLGGRAADLAAGRLAAAGKGLEAASLLAGFAERAPKSAEAPQALARAAELFAAAGAWDRADAVLVRLERAYPGARVTAQGKTDACEAVAAAIRAGEPAAAERARRAPALWRELAVAAEDQAAADAGQARGLRAAPGIVAPTGRWTGLDPERTVLVTRLSKLEARDLEADKAIWRRPDPRGWLGVGWKAKGDSWDVQIGNVVAGSPAAAGGIQPDDVPEFWNGERILSADHMRRLIGNAAGREITLEVRRKDERKSLKILIGRREAETNANESVVAAAFLDCGLLVLARPSCLEAVDPATGESRWVHYPVHPRSASITRMVACDDRIFLSWRPEDAQPAGGAPATDVSMEAVDGRTGQRLWMLQENGVEVTGIHAAPGTGVVVKGEKRGAMAKLRVLNARSGSEIRELLVITTTDGRNLAAAAWDGRLYYLRENNALYVYDLNRHEEASRDLGGQREYPAAFVAEHGQVGIVYANLNRILVLPMEGDRRATVQLPAGQKPVEGGVRFAARDRMYVLAVDETQQFSQITRYGLAAEGPREAWLHRLRGTTGPLKAAVGFTPEAAGWVAYWGSPEATGRPGSMSWLQDDGCRLRWEPTEFTAPEAESVFESAGIQGPLMWMQFGSRLRVFRMTP